MAENFGVAPLKREGDPVVSYRYAKKPSLLVQVGRRLRRAWYALIDYDGGF